MPSFQYLTAQPSPSTGTGSQEMPIIVSTIANADEKIRAMFKPLTDPMCIPCVHFTANQISSSSSADNLVPDNGAQNMLIEFDDQVRPSEDTKRSIIGKNTAMEGSDNVALETKNDSQSSHTRMLESQLLSTHEQTDLSCTGRLSEDGYNWRKYGQKNVKGSVCPRSYYRCTYPGCPVKKIVERSHDGQISQIIYKCRHIHPQLQTANRSAFESLYSFNEMSDAMARLGSYTNTYEESIGTSSISGFEDQIGIDCCDSGMERTTPTSIVMEVSQPVSISNAKHTVLVEFPEDRDHLPSVTGQNYDEDGATQGSMSLDDEGEDDEGESKRRKKDLFFASYAVPRPKVVIQTESEDDILDDGYRWRKYGQKVVKGNPNPRSYYKCTNPGCLVRKHIERASNDLRSVITTYEGKHNHKVPAERTNNQISSCGSSLHAFNSLSTPNFSESYLAFSPTDMKLGFGHDLFPLQPIYMAGPRPCYATHPFLKHMHFGSYALNNFMEDNYEMNNSLDVVDLNPVKSVVSEYHHLLAQEKPKENGVMLRVPKEEMNAPVSTDSDQQAQIFWRTCG